LLRPKYLENRINLASNKNHYLSGGIHLIRQTFPFQVHYYEYHRKQETNKSRRENGSKSILIRNKSLAG